MNNDGSHTAAPAISALLEAAKAAGGLRAVSREAGRSDSALQTVHRSGSVPYLTMCVFLDAMGIDPDSFYAYAYRLRRLVDCEPLERFGATATRETIRHGVPIDASRLRLEVVRGQLPPVAPTDGATLAAVADVDALRYEDARQAANRGRLICARAVSMAGAAAGLGTWASALRTIQGRGQDDRMRQAQGLLWLALRISAARPEISPAITANLLQRATYVVGFRSAAFGDADGLAAAAERIYLELGNMAGVGRALVDRAIWLRRDRNNSDAPRLLDRALEILPSDDHRNRFTALQCKLDDAVVAGDIRQAERFAREALAHATNSLYAAHLEWFRARIAARRGQDVEAVRLYRAAADAIAKREPVEAAMIAGETVRALARLGRLDQASELARGMAWAIAPLEVQAPSAAAALADLIRLALEAGRVTAAAVEQTAQALERASARTGAPEAALALA